jgi:V-type H+-transporting ATPase subunit G
MTRQAYTNSLRNQDRTKRVKEARDEAKKEIDAYKAEKEAEFKKFEAEV